MEKYKDGKMPDKAISELQVGQFPDYRQDNFP